MRRANFEMGSLIGDLFSSQLFLVSLFSAAFYPNSSTRVFLAARTSMLDAVSSILYNLFELLWFSFSPSWFIIDESYFLYQNYFIFFAFISGMLKVEAFFLLEVTLKFTSSLDSNDEEVFFDRRLATIGEWETGRS